MRRGLGLAIISIGLLLASTAGGSLGDRENRGQIAGFPAKVQAQADFGRMPLYFIANEGQMDNRVPYYIQGKDKTLYFTSEGVTIILNGPRKTGEDPFERWVMKLDFVGANPGVKPIGTEKTEAVISYFKGKPEDWKTALPTYSKIVYPDLWPGIDLVYYGTINRLKYEFIVHPGAYPSQIRLAYRGVSGITVNEDGRLEVTTPLGGFLDDVPVACQEVGGKKRDVQLAYRIEKKASAGGVLDSDSFVYGFQVGEYDRSLPLVLDPAILVYCGYIGGSGDDYGRGIAVDGSGNAYVTGEAYSTEAGFPVSVGPDLAHNGSLDVFVAKVNSSGTALLYCGYIGGSANDYGRGIAVDGSGNAYVTGTTASAEASSFPVSVGPDLTYNGSSDGFVAKVNSTGTALLYCGYIGGSIYDSCNGIAVDGSGNAYVTGTTTSPEDSFPVSVGPDLSFKGYDDAFVAKVNSSGTALLYCGYIGGSESEDGRGIAVDGSGNAYVMGHTASTEVTFPVLNGPDLTQNGNYDTFVAKVTSSGTTLSYCGYIGGSGQDFGAGIVLDGSGNAYVTGYTYSSEASFPVCVGPDLIHNGAADAFVAKVDSSGSALLYCGYIGGSSNDYGYDVGIDGSGNAYITGYTFSFESTFPVTVGPDLTYNGGMDAFVARIHSSGSTLSYCGYIGGAGDDEGWGIAVDGQGNAYITGYTYSNQSTFPVTMGPDLSFNLNTDAFVAKVSAYEPQLPVFDGHDYDGNGTSDISIYRPSNGVWYISGKSATQWGAAGDIPVPGNYDLDAATEIAIFRPSGGLWYISGISTTQWGAVGDIPVPHDYNGGGVTDLAVWRPSNGVWYINGVDNFQWGQDGDYPVPADYNGDGVDEVAVWRPANGEWFIYGGGYSQWGAQGDIPVPADYDGDGTTDVAVYRPSIGMWYIQYSGGGTAAVQWGTASDIPVPGDYDGNGSTDVAIWRSTNGLWYIYGGATTQYGTIGDIPLVR